VETSVCDKKISTKIDRASRSIASTLSIAHQYGFYDVGQAGKYIFRENLVNDKEDAGKKVLYIGMESEIPDNLKIIDKVNFVKGDTAFVLAEN
jgi:hypothetical protein